MSCDTETVIVKKRIPVTKEEGPPEWFCYRWEHLRLNTHYQFTFDNPMGWSPEVAQAADKQYDTPDGQEMIQQAAKVSGQKLAYVFAKLPILIDPKLDSKTAWQEAKRACPQYPQGMYSQPSSTDPNAPEFQGAKWNCGAGWGVMNAWGHEDKYDFTRLLEQLQETTRSSDTETSAKVREKMRKFLQRRPVVDFYVNASLPLHTALREFEEEFKKVVQFRKSVGLKQTVQRQKSKWREHLDIWKKVKKSNPTYDSTGNPVFDEKLVAKIFRIEVERLRLKCDALSVSRRSQRTGEDKTQIAHYKRGIDALRRKAESAYMAAEQRILYVYQPW